MKLSIIFSSEKIGMVVVKKGKLYFSFNTLWVYTLNTWEKHNIVIVLTSENTWKHFLKR